MRPIRSTLGALGSLAAIASASAPAGAQRAAGAACTSDTVRVATPTGTLVGSLVCAAGARGAAPVVLFLSGSGPTDRDGNTPLIPGRNDAFHMLADSLAARGIASVRFDKRGVGASRGAARSEAELRFDTLVDDASAWIRKLRADRRFGPIVVVGHSEGALVGMLATRSAGADAFVSLEGPGRSVGAVLRSQLATALPRAVLDASDSVLRALEAGHTVDTLPRAVAQVPVLAALLRPSVQPYLASIMRYDPATELARLTVPVLVVQGTNDTQVVPSEATALVHERAGLAPVLIDGMAHPLKLAAREPTAQARAYQDPSLPVPGALVQAIASFVGSVRKR